MATLFDKIGPDLTLSQQVERKIEEVILQKKILPGEKLPTENELCSMFGVSRTALREALRMLSARGLISIRKGSGIYVNVYSVEDVLKPMQLFFEMNFSRESIRHFADIRKMLEPEIARRAAENRSEQDANELQTIFNKLDKCTEEDFSREGELDRDFHLKIAESCGNPVIPMLIQPIYEFMPKIKSMIYANITHVKSTAQDHHRRILEMILTQNSQGAFDVMKEHMQMAEAHAKALLEVIEDEIT
jgi:GntR family transcriptional repressor for pyruvate dehydrogenase complex